MNLVEADGFEGCLCSGEDSRSRFSSSIESTNVKSKDPLLDILKVLGRLAGVEQGLEELNHGQSRNEAAPVGIVSERNFSAKRGKQVVDIYDESQHAASRRLYTQS